MQSLHATGMSGFRPPAAHLVMHFNRGEVFAALHGSRSDLRGAEKAVSACREAWTSRELATTCLLLWRGHGSRDNALKMASGEGMNRIQIIGRTLAGGRQRNNRAWSLVARCIMRQQSIKCLAGPWWCHQSITGASSLCTIVSCTAWGATHARGHLCTPCRLAAPRCSTHAAPASQGGITVPCGWAIPLHLHY